MDPSSLQSLHDAEVFSPCSIEHQDVFMYDDERRDLTENEGHTYLDISVSKNVNFPIIKTDPDPDTLMSWTQKHPEHWSQNEILDWIYFVAGTLDVDHSTIRGEGFQNITGPELCRMTMEDFLKRDPVNGKCFYEMFRTLHKDAHFIEPQGFDSMTVPDQYNYTIKSEKQDSSECLHQSEFGSNTLDSVIVGKEMQVRLGEYWYPIDCGEDKYFSDESTTFKYSACEGYGSSDSESISDHSEVDSSMFDSHRFMNRSGSTGSDVMSDDDLPTVVPSHLDGQKPLKRKPAGQRKKSSDPDKQQNRGRKPGQISKGNHLWEFIRDLLKDSQFNPHLLRWEEKETGVFRFVQSEAVAKMWGRKKNNPGMTYEKLSRAMRYYYKRGILDRVDGRRLVYKFGVNSHGWK